MPEATAATAQAPTPICVKKSRRVGVSSSTSGPNIPSSSGNVALLSMEAAHRDRPHGTAHYAEPTANADLFVLEHDRSHPPILEKDRRDLDRADRERDHASRGDDGDALLRTDVLAAAAEDAFGPGGGVLIEDRVGPAAKAAASLAPRRVFTEALLDLGDADAPGQRPGGGFLPRDPFEVELAIPARLDDDVDGCIVAGALLSAQQHVDRLRGAL